MKFKDESCTGDNYVSDADDLLCITVNELQTFSTKTGAGKKCYCVNVTGYNALTEDYVPASLLLKTFQTQQAARAFAKHLVKIIEE